MAVSQATQKSVDNLLKQSFNEMLNIVHEVGRMEVRDVDAKTISKYALKSVMFTISTSNFRIVLLLHFASYDSFGSQKYSFLQDINDRQKYIDLVCELGNNFCGASCRILNSLEFSTGMSTPFVLENKNSQDHIRLTGLDYESHIAALDAGKPLFCASFAMFANEGASVELDIKHIDISQEEEMTGELEFF